VQPGGGVVSDAAEDVGEPDARINASNWQALFMV
jgi:hypothetical protein